MNKEALGKRDVWSLGVTLYYLCRFKKPFADGPKSAVKALGILFKEPEELGNEYSQDLRDLIKSMLRKNLTQRPSLQDILETSYVM